MKFYYINYSDIVSSSVVHLAAMTDENLLLAFLAAFHK
jgi:hypothetical protein